MSTALTSAAVGSKPSACLAKPEGWNPSTKYCAPGPPRPAAVGAAMEVPELNSLPHDGPGTSPLLAAERTEVPGARTSGLILPSRVLPRDEKPHNTRRLGISVERGPDRDHVLPGRRRDDRVGAGTGVAGGEEDHHVLVVPHKTIDIGGPLGVAAVGQEVLLVAPGVGVDPGALGPRLFEDGFEGLDRTPETRQIGAVVGHARRRPG